MRLIIIQILAIASCASVACSLLGTLLMIRGVALISDAISHAVLPGIVIIFLMIHTLESPLLIIGASMAGIATAVAIEYIIQTKRLKKDAAIGFVFPLFFSVGILLICKYARAIHLDTDIVILGELAFCPFNRLLVAGYDCGPYALWSIGTIMLINTVFIYVCYKELSLTTFDPLLAQIMGFHPRRIYYLIMILTSITAVGTFTIVGSIVVVTLMLTPPATAYLLTGRLPALFKTSCALGIITTVFGYALAHYTDTSIAGSIAMANGMLFIITYLCAPKTGLYSTYIFERSQQKHVLSMTLCAYVAQHPLSTAQTIATHLSWSRTTTRTIIQYAQQHHFIKEDTLYLALTPRGIDTLTTYLHKI